MTRHDAGCFEVRNGVVNEMRDRIREKRKVLWEGYLTQARQLAVLSVVKDVREDYRRLKLRAAVNFPDRMEIVEFEFEAASKEAKRILG